MNINWRLWAIFLGLVLACAIVKAQDKASQFASDQLKSEAFKALRGGEYDRTNELLGKAASMSNDPALTKMVSWIQQFATQRQEFAVQKQKGHDKAITEGQKLLAARYSEAALDRVRDAFLLADNKDTFLKEPWVANLLKDVREAAEQADVEQKWFTSQHVYSDLGAMEPTNPVWKDRFKAAAGRLRLLAMYTPDDFKATVDVEVKRREAAEQFINPTTQPTTKPVDENDSFKSDWHEMLRGVRMDMLMDALEDAQTSYWRDVTYKTLTNGGLKGLSALVTTRGLEKAFPSIGDTARRDAFLATINQSVEQMGKASPNEEGRVMRRILDNLLASNQNTIQFPEEVIVNEFADGAFSELDPFSSIIWPSDWDEFNKSTQGEFSGVGIEIKSDDEGNLKVVSPLEDSPAYRMGIHAGDLITRINGKNARNISINQAVKNITGPQGTSVVLTIKTPDGVVKDYTIRREVIRVSSIKGYRRQPGGSWDYFIDSDQKIAYLRMTNFTKSTEEELGKALDDMKQHGTKAIIMDLRNNPGGLLAAATEVCDKFLSKGVIVSTRGERELPGQPPIEAKASPDDVKLPLVVLVNQFSASASEIVSGALQDYKRALIVGERSFGKGSVQMLFPLASRTAALKLTTSHYYLPSGRCIHKEDNATTWGVDPDVKVEMSSEQMRAAQEARIEMEVLRDGEVKPQIAAAPTTGPAVKKDLLAADPQLSAAVLLLKLELAGAEL
ncbi:MAG TPA: S41 family peptidase [Tepidisphaeraceae bacterium]|nr:S41 family peptidase [Tepidisphaeraceae bacterium]